MDSWQREGCHWQVGSWRKYWSKSKILRLSWINSVYNRFDFWYNLETYFKEISKAVLFWSLLPSEVAHACLPGSLEVEAGGSRVQSQLWVMFGASLGYMNLCLKTKQKKVCDPQIIKWRWFNIRDLLFMSLWEKKYRLFPSLLLFPGLPKRIQ